MFQHCKQKQDQLFTPQINDFITKMKALNKKIICVTSGGTSVPLEKRTVRSIENFSTGMRGSLLAEKFLQQGCAVIFYYREKSIMPFTHGLTINQILLSQNIEEEVEKFNKIIELHKKYSQNILYLSFKTVFEYLDGALLLKQLLPFGAIYILCAAVSDFIPKQTPENKIHTEENLSIQLTNSPKILGQLVKVGVLTVSFKLQTDESKLDQRMNKALEKYKIDYVIGNILSNKDYIKIKSIKGEIKQYHSDAESNIVLFLLSCQ